MKKIILYLFLILAFPSINAATIPLPPDTVKVIEGASNLTVSRNGDTTLVEVEKNTDLGKDLFSYKVTVEEQDESDEGSVIDFEIPFGIGKEEKSSSSDKRRLQTHLFALGNLYFGQRFNYSGKGNVRNSFETGIRNVIGIRWSHGAYTPSFSVGLGFGTSRFTARKGFVYAKEGSELILKPVEEGGKVRWTDVNVLNFQVPLLCTLPIGRNVEFSGGVVAYFNTFAQARTEVDFGDYKTTTLYKGLQQRLFNAELTASIGISDIIGFYASWSPMPIFKAPFGPEFKSWSIGVTINY